MPNNLQSDYVAPHFHAPLDVQGLPAALFPPTQIADGAAANPTTAVGVFALLPDMSILVDPPATYPTWEVTLTFTGTFQNDTAGAGAAVRFNGIGNTTRTGTSFQINGLFELSLQATIVVKAGSPFTARVDWATVGGGIATANGTQRKLEAVLRPRGVA